MLISQNLNSVELGSFIGPNNHHNADSCTIKLHLHPWFFGGLFFFCPISAHF